MNIRVAELRDVEAVRLVQADGWVSAWTASGSPLPEGVSWHPRYDDPGRVAGKAAYIRDGIADPDQRWLVADSPEGTLGFVIAIRSSRVINGLYVSRRGQGIGSALLAEALGWLGSGEVTLEVSEGNKPAIRFYERHGFQLGGLSGNAAPGYPLDRPQAQLEMTRPGGIGSAEGDVPRLMASEPITWRGVLVPWAALWSAERRIEKEDPLLIWQRGRLAYDDEVPGDRRLGVLWNRHRLGKHGEPLFGQLHTARQRLAMMKNLCQICGGSATGADGRISWLIPGAESNVSWTMTPPTCAGCVPEALRFCPHLKSNPPLRLTVAGAAPLGVLGDVYQVEHGRFTSVNPRTIVDLRDGHEMRRVLAKQLAVTLLDPQVEG